LNAKKATGYFYVSNLARADYWLNRNDLNSNAVLPNNIYKRIPKKIISDKGLCINSYIRTNKLPNGWLAPTKKTFQPN
jgi:hypothetical protein